MITKKSLQVLVTYVALFTILFSVLFMVHFLLLGGSENVSPIVDSRSPLLGIVLELKETVAKQTKEINQLRLIAASFEDSVAAYKKELFLIKKKLAKDPIPVDKNLKRYALDPFFHGAPPGDDMSGAAIVVSKMCTQADFHATWFFDAAMKLELSFHGRRRKAWELAYVLAVFERYHLVARDAKALVVGEVNQPLSQYLIAEGVHVTMLDEATQSGAQEARAVEARLLQWRPAHIALRSNQSRAEYLGHVDYRTLRFGGDTRLSSLLSTQFDMIWSTGFIEQLENVAVGQAFIMDSLQSLKPGGVAVHVVELILEPRDAADALGGLPVNGQAQGGTLPEDGPVLWHYMDVLHVRDQICHLGYKVKRLTFGIGNGFYDVHPDKPPYTMDNHIKLLLSGHVVTSFALVIEHPKVGLAASNTLCE